MNKEQMFEFFSIVEKCFEEQELAPAIDFLNENEEDFAEPLKWFAENNCFVLQGREDKNFFYIPYKKDDDIPFAVPLFFEDYLSKEHNSISIFNDDTIIKTGVLCSVYNSRLEGIMDFLSSWTLHREEILTKLYLWEKIQKKD